MNLVFIIKKNNKNYSLKKKKKAAAVAVSMVLYEMKHSPALSIFLSSSCVPHWLSD